ncbi:MAG: LysM peptidoglycan-binding domain-containing protein [Ruminococcaceae bacterium]|nr:LysM peptidoglycan-binding domain-containing protein [Oscillospiraceae bacterium]
MAELRLNTEEIKDNGLLRLTNDTVITHDVSEEFSLPDYVPEIRRLLNVRAQALPESKYIADSGSNSSLEIGGTVTYLLIYTDDEGNLCSIPLTSSYEAEATLVSHPTTVFIDTVVDSTSPRVNAPRKITIKSRLKSRILGWENVKEEERIEGKTTADELFIERKSETVKALSIKPVSMQNIRISDKLDMGAYQSPRPVWCDASVTVNDVRAQNNSVSVRGEVTVKCICKDGENMITLTKSVALAEELEAQGATLGDMARVSARPVSLAISNEQSDSVGQLFFDLTCELEGELVRNTENELVTDCYSTRCETEGEYKTIDVFSMLKAQNSSFSINESVKRKAKDICEIIDIMWDPVYEKAEFKNGKAILNGRLNLTLIGKGEEQDGDTAEYLSESYEIPYKYATDLGRYTGELVARCDMSVSNATARLDGDKLIVSAEMHPSFEVIEKNKVKILDTAILKKDKEIKKEAACVRVYFPKEGDTLWEIAKKYHTTVATLKENNDLSTDTVDGIKSIII